MAMSTPGRGLALDIGAGNTGDCSFPLLSQGHTVHMFESGYRNHAESGFVQMTLDANGWRDRAMLHGEVTTDNVEQHFVGVDKIELVKIDVDHNESYEAVFEGIAPILQKTEIVAIEMLTHEIGLYNKLHVVWRFEQRGFDAFGLEDLGTFPGFTHGTLMSECLDHVPEKLHFDDVDERDYVYGENGPKHIRMHALCTCAGVPCSTEPCLFTYGRAFPGISRLECGFHFAFVRRDSGAMQTVSDRFGSCADLCDRMARMHRSEL